MNPKIFDNPPQILWEIKYTMRHTHTHRFHDACATWQIKCPSAFHKHWLHVLDTSAEVRYETVFPSGAIITMPSASEVLVNLNQDYFITSHKYPTSQRRMEVPLRLETQDLGISQHPGGQGSTTGSRQTKLAPVSTCHPAASAFLPMSSSKENL